MNKRNRNNYWRADRSLKSTITGNKYFKKLRPLLAKNSSLAITLLAFGIVGTALLFKSFASTPYLSIQPESGTLSGNVTQATDTTASFVVFGSKSLKFEAEAASTNATVISSGKDYASGKAVIGNFGSIGQFVTFTVNVPSAGTYATSINYASAYSGTVNSGPDPLPRTMLINNANAAPINFVRTTNTPDNWDSLVLKSLGNLQLTSGSNTITFRIDANDGQYWDVDYLEVTGATIPATCPSGTTGTPPNCVVIPPGGNGVGGSGADMTPGRKCAAGTAGAQTISSGGDLNSAVNNLPNNGTLVVNAGTYGVVSISNKSNITVCGAIGARPKIIPNGGTGFTISGSSNNVHIEGFEIGGTATGLESGVRITGNAHHIHVWDMWVHDLGSVGIAAANGYCGHIDFRYNRAWNNAYFDGYHSSGISIYEPRNCGDNTPDAGIYTDFFIGNIVYENGEKIAGATDGNCIIWDDTLDTQGGNHSEGPYLGRALLANNVCVSNGGRGVHIGPTSARADVVNNTNYHNFNPAFNVPDANDNLVGETDGGYLSDDVRFINNVAIARPGKNGFDSAAGTNLVSRNNIYNSAARNGGVGGYQLFADPGFVNANENFTIADFRPRSGSPMINAGIGSYANVIIPNVDVTGKVRSASTPSIGAYEP